MNRRTRQNKRKQRKFTQKGGRLFSHIRSMFASAKDSTQTKLTETLSSLKENVLTNFKSVKNSMCGNQNNPLMGGKTRKRRQKK